MKRRIFILHCGGTIGMHPSNHGDVPLESFSNLMPERLHNHVEFELPEICIVELQPSIDSAMMR